MSESNVVSLNPSEQADLMAAVRDEMEAGSLSQAAVARETGLSASALNQRLKGVYRGDNAAVDAKLSRWLDARRERRSADAQMPEAPAWVQTPSARRIRSALSYAQIAGDIAVIYGGAGVGKTSTAHEYQRQAPNVWIVTMTPATAVVGAALERIALAIGLRPSGRASRIEGEIIERLQGTQGLLIIDEAQHLAPRALEAIRSLQDATGVGVAILGNQVVYTQLTGGNRSIGFAQLFSRIGKRVSLNRPTQADVDALATAWGVTATDAVRLLRDIAKKPGALRAVTKTMRLASMFAAGADADADQPTLEHIRSAYRDLGGD
ncbi:AAA family ATPase [Salinisphaera orenii]|uniref:DNA transposition protein n=1 Tax=Salinisphaera orenii YIM 95161 TaxID=1051139 RepID=A0A423PRL6_9GAMM|nr:AAA family ATPase [Salinisphaera halophila]ROO28227.1 DNA transposition protein [Salinisphaera halophila YIM 95161]